MNKKLKCQLSLHLFPLNTKHSLYKCMSGVASPLPMAVKALTAAPGFFHLKKQTPKSLSPPRRQDM